MEKVEVLNKRLIDHYGKYLDGQPMFRIVFSNDQLEKRWTEYTKEGFQLLQPEVRELPKYSYIHGKYVLERLTEVNPGTDLTVKLSFEPLWVFEDKHGNPLPPKWEVADMVIKNVYNALGIEKKPLLDPNASPEARKEKLDKLYQETWGNETNTGDALAYKEAIVVPRNYGDNQ